MNFVHNFVENCFQTGQTAFKSVRYLIGRKDAEPQAAPFLLRKTSFLPLFFFDPQKRKAHCLPQTVGFSHIHKDWISALFAGIFVCHFIVFKLPITALQ